jgi:hypothetical protein
MLEMPGAPRFRTITAALKEGADHRLTLSSTLGEPVPTGMKVHFLTAVRSAVDRIEIRHASGGERGDRAGGGGVTMRSNNQRQFAGKLRNPTGYPRATSAAVAERRRSRPLVLAPAFSVK